MEQRAGPTFRVPINRRRAALGGLAWLALGAVCVLGLVVLLPADDWGLFWNRERASAVVLGGILVFVSLGILALASVGLRKIALALWQKEIFIEIGPAGVRMELGPYGSHNAAWADVTVQLRDDVDPDILDYLPDAALVIELRHTRTGMDYAGLIQQIGRVSPEEFNRVMRPYLKRGMGLTEGATAESS